MYEYRSVGLFHIMLTKGRMSQQRSAILRVCESASHASLRVVRVVRVVRVMRVIRVLRVVLKIIKLIKNAIHLILSLITFVLFSGFRPHTSEFVTFLFILLVF
jgi:hypothetical protein